MRQCHMVVLEKLSPRSARPPQPVVSLATYRELQLITLGREWQHTRLRYEDRNNISNLRNTRYRAPNRYCAYTLTR
jgi:hypothetical protein